MFLMFLRPLIKKKIAKPGYLVQLSTWRTQVSSVTRLLMISVIGGGLLAFPFAFYSAGLAPSLVLIFVHAAIAVGGSYFVFWGCHKVRLSGGRVKNYQELMGVYYGPIGSKSCEIMLILELGCACIVWLTILGDSITPVIDHFFTGEFYTTRKFLITSCAILLVFPLLFLRKVDSLRHVSVLSLLNVLYLVALVTTTSILHLCQKSKTKKTPQFLNTSLYHNAIPQLFMFFPVLCFGFSCQHILPRLYSEIRRPSLSRLLTILIFAQVIVTTIYLLVGLFGTLQFGNETKSNILMSYEGSNWGAGVGRICVGVQVLLTIPLWFQVLREAVRTAVGRGERFGTFGFLGVTLSMFVFIVGVSIFVPNIGVGIGITASCLTVIIVIVFPGMIGWKVIWKHEGWSWKTKCVMGILPILYVVYGGFIAVVGTLTTIFKIVSSEWR